MKNSGFLMGKEPTLGRIIRTLLGAFVGVVPGVLIHSYGFHFQGIVLGICFVLGGAIVGWLCDSLWQMIWVSLASTIGAVIVIPIALIFGSMYVRAEQAFNALTGKQDKPKPNKIDALIKSVKEADAPPQTDTVTADGEPVSQPKIKKKYRPLPSATEEHRIKGLLGSGVQSQKLAAELQLLSYEQDQQRMGIGFVLSGLIAIGFGAWLWFSFDTSSYRGWEHHEVIGPFVVSCFSCTSILLLSFLIKDYWKVSLLALLGCAAVSGLLTWAIATFVPRSWPWSYMMALWLAVCSCGWLFFYPICDLKRYRVEGEDLKRLEEDFDD